MTIKMNINQVLNSGDVERFHAVPGMEKQLVSSHSWGVALLCHKFFPEAAPVLVLKALTHDCAELITGDVPADCKWVNPEVKEALDKVEKRVEEDMGISYELTDAERDMLKIADALEGMRYCLSRRDHGEIVAVTIFNRWSEFLFKNYKNAMMSYKGCYTYYESLNKFMGVSHGRK
jgi:5'-deoxynucleotidase YfbR-like HD superfamily hydrolase